MLERITLKFSDRLESYRVADKICELIGETEAQVVDARRDGTVVVELLDGMDRVETMAHVGRALQ